MKIRAGFVSNSSSSSFVVAFDKKPKKSKDVLEMMFADDTTGVVAPYDFIDGLPNVDVAKRVFDDVKTAKPATIKSIAEEFSSRYFILSGEKKPYYPASKYCSTDHEIMKEIMAFDQSVDAETEEIDSKIERYIESKLGPEVPYAYIGGHNWSTNKPYTKEDVVNYSKYRLKLDKFQKEDVEYKRLDAERFNILSKKWKKSRELASKLAEIDAQKFLDDNKGKHVVILTYSDDSGETVMEHGDIFRNLNHVRVSHH